MLPVVKAEYAGLFGTATKEEDDGEDEQADHHDDFGAGEPELGLAVKLDGEEVEADDDDDHNGYPDRDVDIVWPVVDD